MTDWTARLFLERTCINILIVWYVFIMYMLHVCIWCMFMHVDMCISMAFSQFLPSTFVDTGPLHCGLHGVYAKLVDLWASKYLPSLLPMKHKSQGYKPVLPCLALCMFSLVKFKSSLWDIKHFIHWVLSLGCTCTIAKINNGQGLLFIPDFHLIGTFANREKNKTYL